MPESVKVGMLGFGTVGTGVARVLIERARLLEHRAGCRITLKRVCSRNFRRSRGWRLPPGLASTNPRAVLADPEITIVIELIGGLEPARRFVLDALRNGKHVVTANKALLASHGREIFAAAEARGLTVNFEASVGGGIPIIRALRDGLVANDLDAVLGIVNGTSNYILSQMSQRHLSFHEALMEAKRHGYAERNPALDINGDDAAHKLAILAWLGFGVQPRLRDIFVEGISSISQSDIEYADEFGYCIKPLAIAKEVDHELEVRVHPTLLAKSHLLANVNGVYNAIYVHGDLVGAELFYGRGAGQNPTASAVVSDVVSVARSIGCGAGPDGTALQRRAAGGSRAEGRRHRRILKLRRMGDVETRYYLRFTVTDRPGVLARIAGVLGRQHISIASVHQKERGAARIVPVVIMTHEAKETYMRRALRIIDGLDFVKHPTVAIRTEAPRSP